MLKRERRLGVVAFGQQYGRRPTRFVSHFHTGCSLPGHWLKRPDLTGPLVTNDDDDDDDDGCFRTIACSLCYQPDWADVLGMSQ